jgi:hypothetical protein
MLGECHHNSYSTHHFIEQDFGTDEYPFFSGVCKCNDGFGNSDCSVQITKKPTFMGVEPDATCDMRKRNCSAIALVGEYQKDEPTCIFEEIKVYTPKTHLKGQGGLALPGTLIALDQPTLLYVRVTNTRHDQ